MFSSIDKLVAQMAGTASIADATRLRDRDCELWLPDAIVPKAAVMAHAATALALRCCTGRIVVHASDRAHAGLPWLPGSLIDQLHASAEAYGGCGRATCDGVARPGALRLALACAAPGAVLADAAGWEAGIDRVFAGAQPAATAASTFAVGVAFARAFGRQCLGLTVGDRELTFRLGDRAIDDGAIGENRAAGDVVLFGAGEVAAAFLYVLSLTDCTARVHIVGDGRLAPPDDEQLFLVGAPDVNARRKNAATLAARLTRDGIDAQAIAVGDLSGGMASLAPQYDSLVCTSFDAAFAQLAARTRAPLVMSASAGARGGRPGDARWHRAPSVADLEWEPPPTRTDVVLRQVQTATAAATMTPLPELVDVCTRIAYHETPVTAPFVSLAAGSLAVAACLGARGAAQDDDRVRVDLLGPPVLAHRDDRAVERIAG